MIVMTIGIIIGSYIPNYTHLIYGYLLGITVMGICYKDKLKD